MSKLDSIARALEGVTRGVACAGTALESHTYKVDDKAFLFVSREHVRLKLAEFAAEARKLGAEVGTGGWTKLSLDALPAEAVLARWIAESHGLMRTSAPKRAAAKPSPAKRAGAKPSATKRADAQAPTAKRARR
ncbi:MAG: hypothetical protein L6Q99_04195 [Planctomycetes bacterium]|nr:hypothetical protein [Planctomycetota bacterium]